MTVYVYLKEAGPALAIDTDDIDEVHEALARGMREGRVISIETGSGQSQRVELVNLGRLDKAAVTAQSVDNGAQVRYALKDLREPRVWHSRDW